MSAAVIDGVINLSKPVGISSAKAIYRVRSITGVRKSGHAGTLDPLAGGVLLICQGKATKLVEQIMDLPKVYRTVARLDVTSESFDSEHPMVEVPVASPPSLEQVRATLSGFEGQIEQTPPRFSAVKLGGIPAYKTVGMSNAPAMRSKTVTVYWTHVHSYDWPVLDFEMCCGRGTYVRALIRDLGKRLQAGGCLTSLTRTAVGPFGIDDGWTFETIERCDPNATYLTPLERAREMVSRRPVDIPDRPAV